MSSVPSKLPSFLHSQLLVTPKHPETDCSGRTIIVTGANTGLGKEAARHIVRLNAERVIITARDASKGAAAVKDLEQTTGRKGVIEVWDLDLASYDNVKAFAKRVAGLPRLDAIIENAGINTTKFVEIGGNESTVTVNVVSTFLLALLVLPKLQETAKQFSIVPNLTIVSSEVHFFTAFPERESPNIFETLNNPKTARMSDRYNVSKLLEVFACRRIARHHPVSRLGVTINFVNPGFCRSELAREMNAVLISVMYAALARTTEVGSRTLVHAGTEADISSHGQYMSDCKVQKCAKLVEGPHGKELEERVWQELSEKLEAIQPGVTKVLGPAV
nr:hypothetical protein B0A51_17956 [Rachicladosporium sp. CCFEE 5018]